MVRNYVKKTNRANIDETDVQKALTEICKNRMSIRTAAAHFNLKKSMLHKRLKLVKGRNGTGNDSGLESESELPIYDRRMSKYASKQVFSSDEERMLNEYILKCSKIHFGLTYKQTRKLAYEYANKLNKKYPVKWNIQKEAGIDWMKSFLKRNKNISLRKPENTSLARATAFNKHNVEMFFKNYQEVLEQYKFEPSRIINIDETGITTVLPVPKVLSEKGKKQVGQIVSAERGQLVTFVGIVTAIGNALPPLFVFPRVHSKPHFVSGGPSGSVALAHKSGWITSTLFLEVLTHVKKHMSASKENPLLILLDNHEAHISIEAIMFCRDNGIVMVSFPPHCSHRLQPLDVGIFGPFKSKLKIAFNDYIASNPGIPISIYNIPTLSKDAFYSAFTPINIAKSFEKPGLWPLNTLAFNDDDFQSCYVTDRPIPNDHNEPNTSQTSTLSLEKEEVLPRTILTPENVRLLPKAPPRKTTTRARGKSCIYTSTPEMEQIKLKCSKTSSVKKAKAEKAKKVIFSDSDSSESDLSDLKFMDTSDDENESNSGRILDDEVINIGDYVLVKFATKKKLIHYVARVDKLNEASNDMDVEFLRRRGESWNFSFRDQPDLAEVNRDDIVLKLPMPSTNKGTTRTSSFVSFGISMAKYNVN